MAKSFRYLTDTDTDCCSVIFLSEHDCWINLDQVKLGCHSCMLNAFISGYTFIIRMSIPISNFYANIDTDQSILIYARINLLETTGPSLFIDHYKTRSWHITLVLRKMSVSYLAPFFALLTGVHLFSFFLWVMKGVNLPWLPMLE